MGPTADHEPPLAETGDLTPGLDGAGIAHLSCNRSHGGKLGAERARKNNSQIKTKPNQFLKTTRSTPAAPPLFPPKGAGIAEFSHTEPRTHLDGWVMPRLETRPPAVVLGSWGENASEWLSKVYGMELRGWQRYALDRALEYDQDKQLVWSTVIITVGRQSGKSWLSRAVCLWRMHRPELFGEPQTILHVANRRSTAMEVLRPAGLWAQEKYGKSAVKWGNEKAGIELPSGDRWLIHAANDSAGVGYSCSMVFVDEAWKVKREVVDDALAPTMAERNNPQLWLVSTAGDSTSDLMQAYRQRALDRLDSDDPGSILLLEWSAPGEADPDLVQTWRWGSPEWTPKREAFLRQQWTAIEESAWRREYLNQWVYKSDHWLKDSDWVATLDPDLRLPESAVWSIAVESDFDGMGHAVAIAAETEDGLVVCRATTHRTIKEVDEKIAEIRKAHPAIYVQVTPGYADRMKQRIDGLVGQREAVTATQILQDIIKRHKFRHDGSQILREHFSNTQISKRQGGWVMTAPMNVKGIYAARALMFAVAQATKAPAPVAMIYTRKRRHA